MKNLKTALIIEHVSPLRNILAIALEEEGMDVLSVSSEDEAWDALSKIKPQQKIACIVYHLSSSLYLSSQFFEAYLSSCQSRCGVKPKVISLDQLAPDGFLNLNKFNLALHQAVAS